MTATLPWSWVHEPETSRPAAKGVGRYTRPLAGRDQVVMVAFGAEVRKLRCEREFSARQLATMLGMSQPAITQIETGKRANIDLRLVWDFAQALGVSAAHLVAVCEHAVAMEEARRIGTRGRQAK